MAKGDAADSRTSIVNNSKSLNPQLAQFTSSLYPQQQSNWQNFNAAGAQAEGDYNNLMSGYANLLNGPGVSYSRSPEMQSAMSGYQDFANTGGFSAQDINDLRARGIAPIRSQYQTAVANLDRNRELQGGYSPNYAAAVASMQRTMPGQLSDAEQAVNANLAQMVQQGKLSGLQGLGGLSAEDASLALQAALSNSQLKLGGLQGAASLYGATPGLANMYGNMTNNNNSQIANSLGLTSNFNLDSNKLLASLATAPSDTDIALNRATGISKIGSGIASGFQ